MHYGPLTSTPRTAATSGVNPSWWSQSNARITPGGVSANHSANANTRLTVMFDEREDVSQAQKVGDQQHDEDKYECTNEAIAAGR